MCKTNSRLDGKTVVITGGSSGIGFETAKHIAHKGAKVIIASRNETKLIRARNRIQQVTKNPNISYKLLDLASLKSVRNFASNIQNEDKLDVLINNAGAVGLSDRLTEDGLNLTMQVNYFGSFLLTYLLLPLLTKSAPSRIINSSASSMYIGHLDFDHWNDIGRYSAVEVLANSKLAVALFTAELDNILTDTGVTANTFDPFIVRDTNILENVPELVRNVSQIFVNLVGQPKEDVANEILFLAADPEIGNISGMHYKFCRQWINHWMTYDTEFTKELWNQTRKILNITANEGWE
ncbi:retinol dehydrogenase 13-like [Pieris rapae]|uniref:retinol dehydrogenase 13-like n=1 Tax=Pieris rapae TaxID=64459 RepID=UPI001E28088F|nr:retinol dehydrogenase 13-like [Pieris rapae]